MIAFTLKYFGFALLLVVGESVDMVSSMSE